MPPGSPSSSPSQRIVTCSSSTAAGPSGHMPGFWSTAAVQASHDGRGRQRPARDVAEVATAGAAGETARRARLELAEDRLERARRAPAAARRSARRARRDRSSPRPERAAPAPRGSARRSPGLPRRDPRRSSARIVPQLWSRARRPSRRSATGGARGARRDRCLWGRLNGGSRRSPAPARDAARRAVCHAKRVASSETTAVMMAGVNMPTPRTSRWSLA